MYIDQSKDPTSKILYGIVRDMPAIVPMIKTAEINTSSKPTSAFADQYNRLFPVDSPANALLSKAYAIKTSDLAPHVKLAIDQALDIYGVDLPEVEQEKVAELEPRYILKEQRKFPVKEASDVPKAEEALNRVRFKLNTKTLASAATELVKAAHASDQNVGDNVLQWAGLTQCDVEKTADWIDARRYAAPPEAEDVFEQLAKKVASDSGPRTRDELLKLADTVEFLDNKYGIEIYYGKKVPNPLETVFSTKTAMCNMMSMGGKDIPVSKLVTIDPETYSDILGEDILEEITTDGELDESKILEIFETLPQDMKILLASKIA